MNTSPQPSGPPQVKRRGDSIFSTLALLAGLTIAFALGAVFLFLAIQGIPGLHADSSVFAPSSTNFWSYVGKLLFGTTLAAVLAMAIAVPVAIAIALVISQFAPKRLATPIAYLIHLLAAVPSVVFGLWGARSLAHASVPVQAWLNAHLGWLPFFSGQVTATGRTILIAAVVLAIMVLPIATAICREVFQQTPTLQQEAALGLGATQWEMIKMAVFPHARSGIVAGMMLGLGRALGETMAVAMVLSASAPLITVHMLTAENPPTIASNIANNYNSEDTRIQAVLIATGLVLFLFTFAVNFAARSIVARSARSGS